MHLNVLFKASARRKSRLVPKIFVVMQLTSITSILMLAACLQVSASAFGQKVTIVGRNISVRDVFKDIRRQTDYNFIYSSKTIRQAAAVTLDVRNASVAEVLDKIFAGQPVTYTIDDKIIIIKPKTTSAISHTLPLKEIQGRVTDSATGKPLVGVTIRVKGKPIGTTTDKDGKFLLNVPDNAILEITYLGYAPAAIPVKDRQSFAISLKAATTGLNQLVVIGYGSVKEKNLTGAVTSVDVDKLPKVATTSVSTMLQGQAPGLLAIQSGAQPGASTSLLIRGAASPGLSNAPLIVIDGFPLSNSIPSPGATNGYSNGSFDILNSLNPNDIASITVLKDASATAIYGARAANGVILITTKKGQSGAPKVSYSFSMSFQQPENPYNWLNAKDWMTEQNRYYYERWLYKNKIAPYGNTDPSTVSPAKLLFTQNEIDNAKTTNWFDLVTRTGTIQQHNISVRAGSDKTQYMISFDYYNDKGILKNIGLKRYTGRINLDQQFGKWLKFETNLTGSYINNQGSQLGGINGDAGILTSAYEYPPNLPVKDSAGNYIINPYRPTQANPVSFLDISDVTVNRHYLSSSSLTADILKGLQAKVTFGFDEVDSKRSMYLPKSFLRGLQFNGDASIAEDKSNSILTEATIHYTKDFDNDLHLSLLAGYSYQNFENEGFNAANTDFATDAFLYNNLNSGSASRPTVGSYKNTNAFNSYFSRLMLNYKSKYLLTLTMRADGASNFTPRNKYGYFPSAAFAWRIINENFMKDQSLFSDLKLRVSVGQTGNSSIGGSAFALYEIGSNVGYAFGNQVNVGAVMDQLANPDLKWETTTEGDIGLDIGLFQNRVTINADIYNKVVSDILSQRTLPSYQILGSVAANIGETQSVGYEVGVHSINTTGPFRWTTDINLSSFKDSWKKRDPLVILPPYESEDAPLHAIYGYLTDGIIQAGEKYTPMSGAIPGELKIKDINGVDSKGQLTGMPDGKISEADEVYLGSSLPRFSFGVNNTFQYKNFDLRLFFYGSLGLKRYNDTRQTYTDANYFIVGTNAFEEIRNRWAHDNQSGTLPSGIVENYLGNSDFYLENSGFLRLKEVSLGYDLVGISASLSRIFQSARVYVDLNNLFVITNYSGSDPETDSFAAYPYPHTISLGLNLQF